MKKQHAIAIIVPLLMIGCTSPFTVQDRKPVVPVTLDVLMQSHSDYEGKVVMFGGDIIAVANRENETEIEVLQKPLDSRGMPLDRDVSYGRFLFVSPSFLDPAVYGMGRKITVIGAFKGMEQRAIGDKTYNYPVIMEIKHHLWSPAEMGPKVRFGVGVGVTFPLK